MEICKEEASGSGNQHFRGQFRNRFAANFSISEKNSHSDTSVCIGFGYDKNGRCYKTNEGLTQLIQDTATRRNKTVTAVLKSRVYYL